VRGDGEAEDAAVLSSECPDPDQDGRDLNFDDPRLFPEQGFTCILGFGVVGATRAKRGRLRKSPCAIAACPPFPTCQGCPHVWTSVHGDGRRNRLSTGKPAAPASYASSSGVGIRAGTRGVSTTGIAGFGGVRETWRLQGKGLRNCACARAASTPDPTRQD